MLVAMIYIYKVNNDNKKRKTKNLNLNAFFYIYTAEIITIVFIGSFLGLRHKIVQFIQDFKKKIDISFFFNDGVYNNRSLLVIDTQKVIEYSKL